MNLITRPLLAAVACLGLSNVASATIITGDWTGNWSGSGITATFNMSIGPQDSVGNFSGSFDWTCTSGITCSGIETFSGGVSPLIDNFSFWTTGFINPVNLGPSVYWGSITNNGNTLVGYDLNPNDRWTANRVQGVPEPSTLILMALGLIGLTYSTRIKKLPAANIH
jgi:hypothetical protein